MPLIMLIELWPEGSTIFYVLMFFDLIIYLYLTAGFIDANLQVLQGYRMEYLRLFKGYKYLLRLILALVVMSLIHTILNFGSLIILYPITRFFLRIDSTITILTCLFVSAIIVIIKLGFTFPLIIDKNLNVIEAVQASWQITKGNFWALIGLFFSFILIVAVGLLALLVGVFIAFPLIFLTYFIVYKKLLPNACLENDFIPPVVYPNQINQF